MLKFGVKVYKIVVVCALYGILWYVWLERNACIFKGVFSFFVLWDRILYGFPLVLKTFF